MSKKESHFNKKILENLKAKTEDSTEVIAQKIISGDRLALAQGITAIESVNPHDQLRAEEIISLCIKHSGNSLRIGVTGVPGVGKSTFIEALGIKLIGEGKKIGVLAIDPTSQNSGGSILGDKTRMNLLSREKNAFIRPSPAANSLGGVAQKTREAIILCEAAGFDIILIETVGVGQSEYEVHSMVDFFLLLMLSGAGDELQGIKRGIMEMADAMVINKADESNVSMAKKAKSAYANALHLLPERKGSWQPPVHTVSSIEGTGLDDLWKDIEKYFDLMNAKDLLKDKRKKQAVYWLKKTIIDQLESRFFSDDKVIKEWPILEKKVTEGELNPFQAARQILELL